MNRNALAILAASAAVTVISSSAIADDAAVEKRLDAMEKMIETQQQQIESQRQEIGSLKHTLSHRGIKITAEKTVAVVEPAPATAPQPAISTQQAGVEERLEKLETEQNDAKIAHQEAPSVSLTGGRPTITSADGRFSAAIRVLGQFDTGAFMQSKGALQLAAANGPDLSSGSNFRRAQLGVQGILFGDWSYFFNYEFGSGVSSGNELQGRIQQAYVEYDGLAPWSFRVGAFPPSVGLEDATGSADTIFFERNSPSDILRNMAGGDGRDGIAVTYAGDRIFGQLGVTGGKTADTTLAFDEQQAVVGRLAGVAYSDTDTRIVISAAGSDILHAPDATAGANSARNVTLQDPPELTIDDQSTKLVTTGAIDAANAWGYGLEAAMQWRNLFAQGGYFGYGIGPRNKTLPTLNFNGWYTQATWVLTGESKGYSSATGAFTAPKPRIPFSFGGGGLGALEIAARYSDLDLNDDAGVLGGALPTGGNRGGEQQIATVAINWYPVSALKFSLQVQNTHINRIGTIPAGFGHGTLNNAEVGQVFDTIAFRSQLSL